MTKSAHDEFSRELIIASAMARHIGQAFDMALDTPYSEVNWGHVGTLKEAIKRLDEIAAFVGIMNSTELRERIFKKGD